MASIDPHVIFSGTKRTNPRLVPCKVGEPEVAMSDTMAKRKDTPDVRAQIDENLKRVFQEALQEEVPDRFKELLEQLRQKDKGK